MPTTTAPLSKSECGRLGGLKRSPTKTESSRANGRRGGRPKIVLTEPLETWRHGVLPAGTRVCGIRKVQESERNTIKKGSHVRHRISGYTGHVTDIANGTFSVSWWHGILEGYTPEELELIPPAAWKFEFRNEDNLRTRAWSLEEPKVKRV